MSECACAHVFWRVRLQSFLFFYPFKIHTRAYLSGELCARCHLLVHVASKNSYLDACPLFARCRLLVNAAVKNSCWSCGSGWQHSWHFMASVYNDLQCTSGRILRIPKTRATCIRCVCAAACVCMCLCVPCCACVPCDLVRVWCVSISMQRCVPRCEPACAPAHSGIRYPRIVCVQEGQLPTPGMRSQTPAHAPAHQHAARILCTRAYRLSTNF